MCIFAKRILTFMPNIIRTNCPPQAEDQQSVLRLRTAPLDVVRVGFVGLGERGMKAVRRFCDIDHARVAALCDVSEERLSEARGLASTATTFDSYEALCESNDVDLVYVCTDWASHVPIALQAMNNGKHVAIEVPAATTLDDCWALVDAAERTRCHCTMLENCCYASCHLGTMAATRRGRMGTIVHVEGAYIHPIGDRWTPWRTEANQQLRGDLYPTHGMGPACQLLDIHRTDWIETLVSMDTEPFLRKDFRNGDHTTTLMRTRLGKTILLQHNVVDPHEYTRRYHVVGTLKSVESSDSTPHDQMSRRMDRRLVHCLHQGLPLDIDVYDLAEWCAVSELSRLSIENGNVPVAFPDFTRSKIW